MPIGGGLLAPTGGPFRVVCGKGVSALAPFKFFNLKH